MKQIRPLARLIFFLLKSTRLVVVGRSLCHRWGHYIIKRVSYEIFVNRQNYYLKTVLSERLVIHGRLIILQYFPITEPHLPPTAVLSHPRHPTP